MRLIMTLVVALFCGHLQASGGDVREFEFVYSVEADNLPTDQPVDVFIPLPMELPDQSVLAESIQSSHPGKKGAEAEHGNRYYHLHRAAGDQRPIRARLNWRVARAVDHGDAPVDGQDAAMQQYLAANRLVPVGHEVLEPILAEIHAQRKDDSQQATARAIYDWVVDNVEYKKVGSGWGNGDTFWACNERYGNCTDFHALFISLARSEGIPARFEIGFPVPADRASGNIGGYHCWVKFYVPGQGWVPIDASEAAKHPEQRELLYGTHPADRIHFTTGRDLVLSEASRKEPLNYFIYPYVEVGGKPLRDKVSTHFSFSESGEKTAGL